MHSEIRAVVDDIVGEIGHEGTIEIVFPEPLPQPLSPRYNIAPTQPVLIIREDISGHRELAPVNWGMIPSWAKDPAIAHHNN